MTTSAGFEPDSRQLSSLPISDPELCQRYQALWTPVVNDVLRERGLLSQVLPPEIMPLRHDMKVAGLAFTIKGAKSLVVEAEMEQRAEMLEQLHEHSVCVWDTSGDDESAQWGEVMSMASMRRGCRGVVVDGGIRDSSRVLALGFPVFSRYRTSNGMLGRFRITSWQAPIRVGDVRIEPGDVIFGDIDGVIVVPRSAAYDVLIGAEKLAENEVGIRQMIKDGLPAHDVVARGGYF